MDYIYQYDIAAIVISLAGIGSFFVRKTVVTRVYKIFGLEILCILLSSLFDLLSIYTIAHSDSVSLQLNYLINIGYVFTTCLGAFLLFLCVYYSTCKNDETSLAVKLTFMAPLIISTLLIITTPVTHLAFYFDENKIYLHGPLFAILYGISAFYLFCIFICVFIYRKKNTPEQNFMISIYAMAAIFGMLLQLVIKNLMIVGFITSIATLHMFLYVENPAKYIDNEIGCFNKDAFCAKLNVNFSSNKKFRIVALKITGLENLSHIIGIENEKMLLKEIQTELLEICGEKKLFRLTARCFAMIVENDDKRQQEVILKTKMLFEDSFRINSLEISLSDFITYMACPADASNVNDVLDLIEDTLSELSNAAVGVAVAVDKKILVQKRRENVILQFLKKAIRKTQFDVFFQPIWSLSENRFTTAEALIRLKLQDEEYGYIGPEEFIPIAEKNGLILQMGEFVFENVCRFLVKEKVWEKGIEFIHVNLSAVQCMQEKLYLQLLSIMDAYHLDYKYINFEVTETAAIVSSEKLLNNMNKLIEKGILFALDDYGTGFSNTSSILKYPFHTIKLDKSMFQTSSEDNKSEKIVEHTVKMVKSLKMEVIAEGIETPEQAIKLKNMGCDYIQGYLFSKPIPGKQFIELLNETLKNGKTF